MIELKNSKQLLYRLIYSQGLVKLEILKIYIKTYFKTGFIWPLKFSAGTFILFDKKVNSSFRLCVNYQDLNNLIIKNQYPLSFISKSLD